MKIVTSKIETQTKWRFKCLLCLCLQLFRALSWRTMTVILMNFHSTLNICRLCCSTWMHISWWVLMGFIQGYSENWSYHHNNSLNCFSTVLAIWKGSYWLKAGKCCLSFQEGQERRPLITDLSDSPQCLVKLWRRLLWDLCERQRKKFVTANMGSQGESSV